MATLIETSAYTANEIYEIQQTDPVEGAATGASYGGIGLSNQPHQQLANRTAFLKGRQDTNITNIGVLQAFTAKFVGLLASKGYIEVPIADVSRGSVTAIIQWGFVDLGSSTGEGLLGPYSFPIPFPNQVLNIMLTTLTPETASGSASGDNVAMISTSNEPTASQFWVWNNALGGANALRGFYWIAIGF